MKKYFFLGLFALSFLGLRAQSASGNSDSLKKEHSQLMSKANAFFSANKSDIDARIKKTENLVNRGTKDTSGAKSLIKLYLSDSIFYQAVIRKGDSLMQTLITHDNIEKKTMSKGDQSDKFLYENEERIDKVKWIISYAGEISKQVEKRLKSANKALKEMRDEISKQEKKKQKK